MFKLIYNLKILSSTAISYTSSFKKLCKFFSDYTRTSCNPVSKLETKRSQLNRNIPTGHMADRGGKLEFFVAKNCYKNPLNKQLLRAKEVYRRDRARKSQYVFYSFSESFFQNFCTNTWKLGTHFKYLNFPSDIDIRS